MSKWVSLILQVTRTALQNAASIAGMMITTECMVIEQLEEEDMPQSWCRRNGRHGRHGRYGYDVMSS